MRTSSSLERRHVIVCLLATGIAGCGGDGDPSGGPPAGATNGCVAGTEVLSIVSGDGQTGSPGTLLAERPTVRLSCQSLAASGTEMPLAGAVDWTLPADSGLVDGIASITKQVDAAGSTSVAWTLADSNSLVSAQLLFASHRVLATGRQISAVFNATTGTKALAQACEGPGGTDHGMSLTIDADTVWSAAGSPHRGGVVILANWAQLSVEAGAVVCVEHIVVSTGSWGAVHANGTAQAPIRFLGTALLAAGTLRHVQGEDMGAVGTYDYPLQDIEDSVLRWSSPRDPSACAQVAIDGDGGSVRRSVISGYGSTRCAALVLNWVPSWDYTDGKPHIEARIHGSVGDAVELADGNSVVTFSNCEISHSGRHGVVVSPSSPLQATLSITGCNLFANGGDAVANQTTFGAEATGNWWGDPAGPQGPSGDGVSGAVDTSGALAGPRVLGY